MATTSSAAAITSILTPAATNISYTNTTANTVNENNTELKKSRFKVKNVSFSVTFAILLLVDS